MQDHIISFKIKSIFTFRLILTVILIVGAIMIDLTLYHGSVIARRKSFAEFPEKIDEWIGIDREMGEKSLKILNPTDYLIRDYRNSRGTFINLYVGYFDNQTEGSRIHSPRSCLPGGGWKIIKLVDHSVPLAGFPEGKITIKKAVVQNGLNKLLVFYWLQSRGRILVNEYLAKFYLIYDSIVRHRSDGAIVRMITPISENEDEGLALSRLEKFVQRTGPIINEYLPD